MDTIPAYPSVARTGRTSRRFGFVVHSFPMTEEKEGWDRGTVVLLAHILVIVGVVAYLINR